MRPGASPSERFGGWYAKAIDKLRELPEGDGAFAALMIALPLYERYIIAKLKLAWESTSEEDVRREIGADLQINDRERKVFWSIFRNGFMHQGMGMAGDTKWLVSHHFGELPEFNTYRGQRCLCIDPWKFTDRMIRKFTDNPQLITASDSFPLADVFAVQSEIFSSEAGAE